MAGIRIQDSKNIHIVNSNASNNTGGGIVIKNSDASIIGTKTNSNIGDGVLVTENSKVSIESLESEHNKQENVADSIMRDLGYYASRANLESDNPKTNKNGNEHWYKKPKGIVFLALVSGGILLFARVVLKYFGFL